MLSEVHDVDSDDEDRKRREEQYREMVEREKQERKLELNKWKVGESRYVQHVQLCQCALL